MPSVKLRRLQVAQLWAIMVQSDSRTLEGKAHAQHAVVIEGVKAGYSNLFACAHRQAQPTPEMNFAKHQAGREEYLLLAVVLSVVKEIPVHFQFRPQFAQQMILDRGAVGEGSAQASDIPYRHGNAQGALHVESPPALPQSDGGRDHGIFRSIAVRAGGNRAAKEGGDDVVAGLFIAGGEAILQKKGGVAKA